MLDVRLGRWFSPDPITHPWKSTYCSMYNNMIWFKDPLGDEIINKHKEKRDKLQANRDERKKKLDSFLPNQRKGLDYFIAKWKYNSCKYE